MSDSEFKTVGLIGKYDDPTISNTINLLSSHLQDHKINVILDEGTKAILEANTLSTCTRNELGESCDLAVVIGGDGTLLNAARSLADHNVPIAGINLGHLGFLTDISPSNMLDHIDEILNGQYLIEERFLLHAKIIRDGEYISESDAFNDVVVHKWNVARMIEIETYVDGKFVYSQRSDGLIVSTPTGSTAYALSAGGPIIHPTLNAMVLVPVCPHTMSNRPIVVDGNSQVEVIVREHRSDSAQVTCDGQITFGLISGDHIQIRKKDNPVRLVHPSQHDHFEILRAKLHWAENP
ncbi:MAG: NAD(+) kinase [Gammaproteobacteria bacterium]